VAALWRDCRDVSGSPPILIDVSWQEPERKFSRRARQNFRCRLRLAEATAPVSFEILSPSPVEVELSLDEAYRVEAAGWKGERGNALVSLASKLALNCSHMLSEPLPHLLIGPRPLEGVGVPMIVFRPRGQDVGLERPLALP
jgi:hypothetical protein